MIMRIWRTHLDETRATEYEAFARDVSLPMFKAQPGFRGLLFGRGGGVCTVVTLWDDDDAVDSLERSSAYRETVAQIDAAGFLRGASHVDRLDVHGVDTSHW